MLAGSILSTLVLAPTIWKIDRYLTDYESVLEQLPPGRGVFPVVGDERRFGGRVIPYRHFAFWYTIRFHGNVPSLFDYSGDGMESNWFMPYFDDTAHRYAPPLRRSRNPPGDPGPRLSTHPGRRQRPEADESR